MSIIHRFLSWQLVIVLFFGSLAVCYFAEHSAYAASGKTSAPKKKSPAVPPPPPPPPPAPAPAEKVVSLDGIGYAATAILQIAPGYSYDRTDRIFPLNIQEYEYLSHYPYTAFWFAQWSPAEIDKLTVKDWMKRNFSRIKGFEKLAEEARSLDEFGMAEKKQTYAQALIECWRNYRREYLRYLEGINGFYVIKLPPNDRCFEFPGYDENHIKDYEFYPGKWFTEIVQRDSYNFDANRIKIMTVGGDVYAYSGKPPLMEIYTSAFNRKYNSLRKFPGEMEWPMTIGDAKKLFGDNKTASCETLLTIKLKFGDVSDYFHKQSDFDIYKVVKKCYPAGTNLNDPVRDPEGQPSLIMEIQSAPGAPLH